MPNTSVSSNIEHPSAALTKGRPSSCAVMASRLRWSSATAMSKSTVGEQRGQSSSLAEPAPSRCRCRCGPTGRRSLPRGEGRGGQHLAGGPAWVSVTIQSSVSRSVRSVAASAMTLVCSDGESFAVVRASPATASDPVPAPKRPTRQSLRPRGESRYRSRACRRPKRRKDGSVHPPQVAEPAVEIVIRKAPQAGGRHPCAAAQPR